jgi:hypothetical protein
VLCHTSYRRLERSQARASLPNQARTGLDWGPACGPRNSHGQECLCHISTESQARAPTVHNFLIFNARLESWVFAFWGCDPLPDALSLGTAWDAMGPSEMNIGVGEGGGENCRHF